MFLLPTGSHIVANFAALTYDLNFLQQNLRSATSEQQARIIAAINDARDSTSTIEVERVLSPIDGLIFLPTSNLSIAGVERTQATQFFAFNGEGSGVAGDNSVPLVANKSLILRVYVNRANWSWLPSPASVTGTVTSARLTSFFPLQWTPYPDLSPINGPTPALPSSAIDRGNANQTLNFRIPAANCIGLVRFTVTVFDPGHPGETAYSSPPVTFYVSFGAVPQVRIHGVLIHYTGRGLNIPAPTGIDLINTLAWVGRAYPISGFNYTACDVVEFNGDLTVGGGGGCGTGWNQLFNMLWNMRNASGTNDVFVGLLPPGVPTGGVIGCGGGGVAIGYVGDGTTLAQEIGHAFGRAHAPCGNPGGPDPNYPVYGSYPSGSIGEFGFDDVTSDVWNPASTYDFMSYCGPVWTSPYTYVGLMNGITSSMAAAHPDRAQVRQVARDHLYLNASVDRDGKVTLLPSYHLHAVAPVSEGGLPSPISCDLLDADGHVLETHHCRYPDPHQDPDGPALDLHEVLPWDQAVKSITFYRDGKECDTIVLEEASPVIEMLAPKTADRRKEWLRVEWKATHAAQPLTYLLRYSNDGGATWRGIASDLTETRTVVNLDLLPGGDRCLFQVAASAGIRTAVAETEPFAVPQKPRQAHILAPDPAAVFLEGQSVVLRGGGFSPDFGTTDFEDIVWSSQFDGVIGVGYEVITHTLSIGRHKIILSVPDGLGGETNASVFIEVKPRE